MYHEFFGLQKAPFNLTPDPEFLYLTPHHREALAGLTYAILARKGFVVLTGEAGTGKTTILTRILSHLPVTRVESSVIVNPTLSPAEFLESALLDFGFHDVPASKAQRIVMLQAFLWTGHRNGKVSALVIDEAHKLSAEVLEEVRLLGNFESSGEKLLQIVLVGQRELGELLNQNHLRQLKQRIALRLEIEPLQAADVERYIGHRWMKAGGTEVPFTEDAVSHIAAISQGIPRVINLVCDNALMQAFGEGSIHVDEHHVLAVSTNLHLAVTTSPGVRTERSPTLPAEAAPFAPVDWDYPIKTLERYGELTRRRRSLISRLAGKLGITHRIEAA